MHVGNVCKNSTYTSNLSSIPFTSLLSFGWIHSQHSFLHTCLPINESFYLAILPTTCSGFCSWKPAIGPSPPLAQTPPSSREGRSDTITDLHGNSVSRSHPAHARGGSIRFGSGIVEMGHYRSCVSVAPGSHNFVARASQTWSVIYMTWRIIVWAVAAQKRNVPWSSDSRWIKVERWLIPVMLWHPIGFGATALKVDKIWETW